MKIAGRSINHWFGTDPSITQPCASGQANGVCAYAVQSDTRFGDVRTGSLRAPGFFNIDAALQKSFVVYKENRVDFRADFFNVGNIASYGNPDNGITDPNFGADYQHALHGAPHPVRTEVRVLAERRKR